MNELLFSGTTSCAGCPIPLVVRPILNIAGKKTIIVNATSCSEITTTQYPKTAWGVNYIHCLFENAAAVASGVEAALKKLGKNGTVIALAGDGGTYDIGLQALSGMIDRGHNVLYVCYDNECYANTGIQRSSATPYAAWTTTSPRGKVIGGNRSFKKPIAEMVAAQGAPYVAVSSLGYPKDIEAKVKKALSIEGPKFMLIHAPCPLSWRFDNSQTFSMARAAVESGMWAMYEIENGAFRITYEPSRKKSISEYLKVQGRFKDITDEEIKIIEEHANKDWVRYRKMQEMGKK